MKTRIVVYLLLACATGFTIFWLVRSDRQWEAMKRDRLQDALADAAGSGNLKLMQVCLDAGARVDDGTPLVAAVSQYREEAVRFLLDHGANPNGGGAFPPLFYVGQNWGIRKDPAKLPVAELLLERGANPNARNGYGETPLSNARSTNDPELAFVLQRYGAHN